MELIVAPLLHHAGKMDKLCNNLAVCLFTWWDKRVQHCCNVLEADKPSWFPLYPVAVSFWKDHISRPPSVPQQWEGQPGLICHRWWAEAHHNQGLTRVQCAQVHKSSALARMVLETWGLKAGERANAGPCGDGGRGGGCWKGWGAAGQCLITRKHQLDKSELTAPRMKGRGLTNAWIQVVTTNLPNLISYPLGTCSRGAAGPARRPRFPQVIPNTRAHLLWNQSHTGCGARLLRCLITGEMLLEIKPSKAKQKCCESLALSLFSRDNIICRRSLSKIEVIFYLMT